jgi:hypothetical protein
MNHITGTKIFPDGPPCAYIVRVECRGCHQRWPNSTEIELPRGLTAEEARRHLVMFTCKQCTEEDEA